MNELAQAESFGLSTLEDGIDVLAFDIGSECYALPLRSIREIVRTPPLTDVPRAPKHILGVAGVRGAIVSVVDLSTLIGRSSKRDRLSERLLLINTGDEVVGAVVDRVQTVFRLDSEEVELSPEVDGSLSEHVVGIGRPRDTEHMLILLDPQIVRDRGER